MNRYCVDCKWFKDANLHPVYKTPRCTVRGDDDAAYMRKHICGLDAATLYEIKPILPPSNRLARHAD